MFFDIIIVSYRCNRSLVSCLSSLNRWGKDSIGQIFVVDNSESPLPPWLKERFKQIRWIENKKNIGFAGGCNRALSEAKAPWVCLLNPDTVLAGPIWSQFQQWLPEKEHIGVVGPKILDVDGRLQGSARSFPGLLTAFFGRTSLISRLSPGNPITRKNILTRPTDNSVKDVDWVSGACMLVNREAIRQVGPLDTGFFLYWEDCDWCTRMKMAGWRIVYHPGLGPVRHIGGVSSKRARLKSLYHFHKSAVKLYWKYDRSPLRLGSLLALVGAAARFGLLLVREGTRRGEAADVS